MNFQLPILHYFVFHYPNLHYLMTLSLKLKFTWILHTYLYTITGVFISENKLVSKQHLITGKNKGIISLRRGEVGELVKKSVWLWLFTFWWRVKLNKNMKIFIKTLNMRGQYVRLAIVLRLHQDIYQIDHIKGQPLVYP